MADNKISVEVSAEVSGLNKGLKQADQSINKFSKSAGKAAMAQNNLAKSARVNAVPAMTSVSQVMQDAPYGIRGVANNIQQLTAQFGYLSRSTGGAKSAVKAMISSLAGPAGILFAVSAVTSLLVTYGDELFKNKNAVDDNKEAEDRLNDALRAQLDLRKLLKDELSVASRIKVAEAKLAGKSEAEQYAVRKEWSKIHIASLTTQLQVAKELYKKNADDNMNLKSRGEDDIQEVVDKSLKQQLDLEKNLNDAKAQLYLDDLNEKIRIQKSGTAEVIKVSKESALSIVAEAGKLAPIVADARANISLIPPQEILTEEQKRLHLHLSQIKVALERFNADASQVIHQGIGNTFADLGYLIGDALATGGNVIQAAGKALLGGLGGVLIQLGEMAIQIGIGLLGIQLALKSLNPVAAIAAGVALIALGGFFASKSAQIGDGMGSGGDYTGSTGGSGSSSYSGSTVSSSRGASDFQHVVFNIEGTKLVGVLSNTLARNRSLGGSLGLT